MAEEHPEYKYFDTERRQIAQDLADLKDKSPKGAIDGPVLRFLELINAQPDWISTSTCSGRLVTYLPGMMTEPTQDPSGPLPASSRRIRRTVNGKGGGIWLFVSHSALESNQLDSPIETLFGNECEIDQSVDQNIWPGHGYSPAVHLVYQPPVFHLLARSVTVAVPLLSAVIGAGFRNSGLTVGHRGRVILAIRPSTGGLDVPIAIKKSSELNLAESSTPIEKLQLLVPLDYLTKLLHQGNKLMQQNEIKLQRLFEAISRCFQQSNPKPTTHWESFEERRRRMKSESLAARDSLGSRSRKVAQDSSSGDDIPELSLIE